jgi:hypothetical protein
MRSRPRSYADDVLAAMDRIRDRFEGSEYGGGSTAGRRRVPARVDREPAMDARLPVLLVPGAVHGYETRGVHVDLHETADTDESEFRPALAARDGTIPDGFYTEIYADSPRTTPAACVEAQVAASSPAITHVAQ